jgi:hypothetical protein
LTVLIDTPSGHCSSSAEKGGEMKRKNKQSEKVIVALLFALTAMFNFLANLVHLWTK